MTKSIDVTTPTIDFHIMTIRNNPEVQSTITINTKSFEYIDVCAILAEKPEVVMERLVLKMKDFE